MVGTSVSNKLSDNRGPDCWYNNFVAAGSHMRHAQQWGLMGTWLDECRCTFVGTAAGEFSDMRPVTGGSRAGPTRSCVGCQCAVPMTAGYFHRHGHLALETSDGNLLLLYGCLLLPQFLNICLI